MFQRESVPGVFACTVSFNSSNKLGETIISILETQNYLYRVLRSFPKIQGNSLNLGAPV